MNPDYLPRPEDLLELERSMILASSVEFFIGPRGDYCARVKTRPDGHVVEHFSSPTLRGLFVDLGDFSREKRRRAP